MTKIAIVDDHSLVLQGLELLLRESPGLTVVGLYQNGEQLMTALKAGEPVDVLLLDIHLPGTNGVEWCKIINGDYPEIKIVGLSMVSEISLVRLMIKNGARGYLHKNAGKEEIIRAVQRVNQGERYFSGEIAELLLTNQRGGDQRPRRSPFPRLSRREKEVLQLIVEEFTTQEIADRLFISFGTVETHRRNILSKLGARNTAGLVRIAMEYKLLE